MRKKKRFLIEGSRTIFEKHMHLGSRPNLRALTQQKCTKPQGNAFLRRVWNAEQVGSRTVACYDIYKHFCYHADSNFNTSGKK